MNDLKQNKFLQKIKCFFGFHENHNHLVNLLSDDGKLVVFGWCECPNCGYSKIKLTYRG